MSTKDSDQDEWEGDKADEAEDTGPDRATLR